MTVFNLICMASVVALVVATDPVPLGKAGGFAILTKAGISSVPPSIVKGNIGVSPIASTAITGFGLSADPSNKFSVSSQVVGRVYAANYAIPTPSDMTTAIGDMGTAYTDAAGRTPSSPSFLNVQSGLISGTTFKPGVYTWGSDVMFSSDIYIKGSSEDIFIFQSSGNVIVGSGAKVILVDDGNGDGPPRASNIVWQVAGYVDAGTTSHLQGTFLSKTHVVFKTGSSLNGRILAQTACTLDSATIVDSSHESSTVVDSSNEEGMVTDKPSTEDDGNMKKPPIEDNATTKDPSTKDSVDKETVNEEIVTVDKSSTEDSATMKQPSNPSTVPIKKPSIEFAPA